MKHGCDHARYGGGEEKWLREDEDVSDSVMEIDSGRDMSFCLSVSHFVRRQHHDHHEPKHENRDLQWM